MPPGPAYNWLCVAHSVVDILSHAARIRVEQVSAITRTSSTRRDTVYRQCKVQPSRTIQPEAVPVDQPNPSTNLKSEGPVYPSITRRPLKAQNGAEQPSPQSENILADALILEPRNVSPASQATILTPEAPAIDLPATGDTSSSASESAVTDAAAPGTLESATDVVPPISINRKLQSSKVPSSRVGRLFHYGGLAASLGYGAASELLRRSTSSEESQSGSLMLTEGNIKRLVSKLTQLRGAALKLGQFMSIQVQR